MEYIIKDIFPACMEYEIKMFLACMEYAVKHMLNLHGVCNNNIFSAYIEYVIRKILTKSFSLTNKQIINVHFFWDKCIFYTYLISLIYSF